MSNVNGVISPLPANGGEALDRLKENIKLNKSNTHWNTHKLSISELWANRAAVTVG